MKTLGEQNMKQQVAEAEPIQANSPAGPIVKLIDTTNLPQQNGKQRKSIGRQQQVGEEMDEFVSYAKGQKLNGSDLIGKSGQLDRQQERQKATVNATNNNSENLVHNNTSRPNRRLEEAQPLEQRHGAKGLEASSKQRASPRQVGGLLEEQAACKGAAAEALRSQEKEGQQKQKQQQPEQAPTPAAGAEIGPVKKLTIDCLLYLIKGLIATYDLISTPICYFKYDVARRRREVNKLRSLKLDPNDPESAWRQVDIEPQQLEIERRINAYQTYDQLMKASYRDNASFPCYGYRQVTEERMAKRPDNPDKLIRQVKLSEYKWCTYGQFELQIEAARRGFLRDGVRAGQRVILFADTRAEWQICSQALIRLGAVVATMYSTLGIDGIVHTVNETQAQLIITQRDKVNRLAMLSAKLPQVKRIIHFETSLYLPRQLGGHPEDEEKFLQFASEEPALLAEGRIERSSFCRLLKSGLEMEATARGRAELEQLEKENNGDNKLALRTKDSLAVIMYTSGSTGIPKGVLISHGNIQATIKSFSYVTKDFIGAPRSNVCTAYLPLAHIFEFCIESVMLFHGVRFGFASPHTLTDKSPGLMPGQVGDLSKLQPTIMIIVPLILDRIVQGIKQALKAQSYFKEQLVSYLIDYKIYWQQRQHETPLVDKLICSKMAAALGGRAKYVICGSAPLSGQTQTFVRAALNLKLPQGFGTTETSAATACQLFDDQSTQNVGLPVSGAHIKLEAWPEGNYRPDDKPNARGEIVVGGEMIAHGYYNLDEQTKEAFYVDNEGRRWYRTGDIGEFLPNGQLKIIDRKKDLVKLQNGEYISLGRVESTLKSNPYTDNFCVYANSNYNYVIALGPANELALRTLAQQIVEDGERKPTPSMMRRFGGSQGNLSQSASFGNNLASLAVASEGDSERESLLMSDGERQAALAELKEVLASYETDRLNNNETTTTKTTSADEPARPRATSTDSSVSMSKCLNERLNRLCQNALVQERVLAFVVKMARERNLLTLEIPKKILLLAEDWTEDKNLVTAAMKIRRNYIYKRYEQELDQLYAGQQEEQQRRRH